VERRSADYRQLRDRVVAMILDGVLNQGDPLPSVRTVAAEYRVNPLTVLKGYQQLVDEQLVEKSRRMFIKPGRTMLLRASAKFLTERWPRVPRPSGARAERGRASGRGSARAGHREERDAAQHPRASARLRPTVALDGATPVESGRIVGLIGRNGAGKTTALKSILGLTGYQGSLRVLGRDPATERDALMRDVCFIADTAVLPRWLKVSQAVDFVAGVHPRFDRARADAFLATTDIQRGSRIGTLSKGMVTQLHLALILAIDARLLVLDEPTLGLDLLYRRQFYDTLLNDYFDKERTILLTTHQVEEVEHLLTDVLFIDRGRIVLDGAVEDLGNRYQQLNVAAGRVEQARALKPFHERELDEERSQRSEGDAP
jgi:ABC-2 type transport system ATP-binding protein